MAHQSPLIAIPRKTTSDADWAGPVRATIAHSFGESPDSYSEEIAALQRCRQDAVRGAGSDTTARDLLYKYFGQLELLELRFAEIKVSFGWNDAFTGKLTTQTSLAYEKASIIHLLAAVLSSLAANQSRADPEGLKRAYFNARATAGMLTYINENFLHAPSTDLSRDVVHFLINLMLAQATEIFMEKLVDEKKAAGLVARTANQVAGMYNGLVDEMKEHQGKGIFDRNWMSVLQTKQKYYASVAQFYKAQADDAAGKHGVALARYKLADDLGYEAKRYANSFNYSFVPASTPTLPTDAGTSLVELCKAHAAACVEAKNQATKDNDLIYHDAVPSEVSLPPIEKLPPPTPVTIQDVYGNPEVSKLIGPDMFARLIPLAVHESASVYSEEKAKLARGEVERVEISEAEIRGALEHMGFPAIVSRWRKLADGEDEDEDISLSSEVVRIANEVRDAGSIDAQVQKLEGERARFERELQQLSASLDNESRECERARAKYNPNFTQSPSGPLTNHFRSTISQNLQALQSATSADQQIIGLWREIQPAIASLKAGPDGLQAQARDVAAGKNKQPEVPQGMSLLDLQDEEQVTQRLDANEQEELRKGAKEAQERLDRLHKIRRERDEVLKDLKEKIQNDDVSNLLLLNRRSQNVEPQLFASELEKFRPYQSRLAAAVNASKQIVTELEGIVQRVEKGQGVRRHARSDKERTKRLRDWERSLERAGAQHAEVVAGLSKGLGYYESLDRVVSDIAREVKNFLHQRDSERSRLVSELETRQRLSGAGGAGSGSPAPASRDIGSQLAGLSLNAPTNAPGIPPKPSSPYAPPKHSSPPASNPYDFSALSSLSNAPSSFQTGSPAPPPPPPNRSTSGGYPSFPSVPSGAPSSSPSAPYPPPPKPQGSYPPPPGQQSSPYPAPPQSHSSSYPAPPQQQQSTGSSYTPSSYPSHPSPQHSYSPSAPQQPQSTGGSYSAYPPPPKPHSAYPPSPPKPSYSYGSPSSQGQPQYQPPSQTQPSYQPPSQYGQQPQYQPPQQSTQYQPPGQSQQYQPPGQNQQYQPPQNQYQPPSHGQHSQHGQHQYQPPPSGQYQPPQQQQQYGQQPQYQPPGGQQYQPPPGQQPQYQPPQGQQPQYQPPQGYGYPQYR